MERDREREAGDRPAANNNDRSDTGEVRSERGRRERQEPLEVDLWPFGANGSSGSAWGGGRR